MLDTALTILEPIWFASDDILISCILLFLTSILFSWVYQFLHGYLALNALISEGVYYVATFAVVMMILAQLFGSATAQAVVGGIGIGFGYAFQPYVVAVFNALVMRAQRYFERGNRIRVHNMDAVQGRVQSMGLFFTVLEKDNERIVVPNQVFDTSPFSVYT